MKRPICLPYEQFAALRPERSVPRIFERIWVRGSVEGLRAPVVAIVGTRAATAYGKSLAHRFACELARAGCGIISGLALGIDAAAHRGALEAGGATLGVLGSGHEHFFPARNAKLAQEMLANGGAVLSPFEPQQPAFPSQFLERNGVVAALADAVVVIEAPARSGALNTAGWAAGRVPVFAVPGDVDRVHVAGCHALIRDGAILARSAADVLDDLQLSAPAAPPKRERSRTPSDPLQRRLVDLLGAGECDLDELIAQAGEPTARVLSAVCLLELAGTVDARPGRRYVLR